MLASGGVGGVLVWDVTDENAELPEQRWDYSAVHTVAWSPDGPR